MTRRAFTLLEVVCAVVLMGVAMTIAVTTYSVISRSWEVSTEYIDRMQRTDHDIDQLVTALRCAYYPHNGAQSYDYGFVLADNGNGEDPRSSDEIEWPKKGAAIVGNKTSMADTVHRVRVMVLEEGSSFLGEKIEKTGLYARLCPDLAVRPKDGEVDYSLASEDMYKPVLVADGVVGMNCRVLKSPDQRDPKNDKRKFEDKWDTSNAVPYKVELSFRILDRDAKSYSRNASAPAVRIVRIPAYEQSNDGAAPPGAAGGGRRGR